MATTIPTNIGLGPQSTQATGGTHNATGKGALNGAIVPLVFNIATVGAVTDSVAARFKAPANMRFLCVNGGTRAVTGASSVKLYNATTTANITGAITVTSGAAFDEVTTFTNETCNDGAEIQLLVTAGTSITDLTVVVLAVCTSEPSNAIA